MSSEIKLDSPIWQHLPLELIREVVDWLIVGYEKGRASWSSQWYNLKTLRLVCRQWHKRMRPHMWQTLRVHENSDVAALVSAISIPNSQYRNATKLVFSYVVHLHPRVLRQLGPLLPATEIMDLSYINWSDAACAHPSWGRHLAASFMDYKRLSELHLRNCRLHSSLDVLRILAILPALSYAELDLVQWTFASVAAPHKTCNRLTRINSKNTLNAPTLLLFWSLPHSLAICGEFIGPYPGLHYDEARVLTQLCLEWNNTPLRTFHMTLMPSLYPLTWALVISLRASGSHEITTIEVTICRRSEDDTRGCVRWILVRFKDTLSEVLQDRIDRVGHSLSQLRRLEKVVLEHHYRMGGRDTFPKSWAPLKNKVYIRSRKESKAYTLSVMRQGISVRAPEQFPVSPRWSMTSIERVDVDEDDFDRRSDSDSDSLRDYVSEDEDGHSNYTQDAQEGGKFTDEEEDDSEDGDDRSEDDGYES